MFFTTGAALQAAIDSLPLSKKGSYTPFDAAYYKAKYMEGHEGDLSPLEHFVQIGAALGNQPNPAFNPAYYEARYPDLTGKGYDSADLLIHFLRFGLDEGRVATPELSTFDGQAYLLANPDVLAYVQANITQFGGSLTNGAIAHYVKFGEKEGRAPFYEGNNTFTLTEAYVTYDTVTKTIVDGGSVTTTTPIVTLVDPIVTRETYWISTESGGAVPLQDLITLIGNRLFTSSFADIDAAMKIFNGSLGAIKDITLAGASDLVQDEANNTGVAGGNVTGAVGNLGSGTGNTGSASGTGGAGGADGTGGAGTGGTIIYNEDGTIKQGDYTGDYTITVTLNDGTLYSTVLKLSESQLEFIKGLLFDANGNSRLEEREVEIYSYMPLLARNADTGALIAETDSEKIAKWGPWKVLMDVDGKPIPVRAYDIRFVTETTENPDTVDETVTGTTKVLVPIVLTPTENNGGLVNGGTGFKPTAGNDTIVAGRLELLHQAYIDAGGGYNTLEVDAKGTYAQPAALLNIQQVNVNNLPNVYTVPTGAGGGYLDNSAYPDLAATQVGTSTGISANLFVTENGEKVISITSLTLKIADGPVISIPVGKYTAAQLAETINLITGKAIASADNGAVKIATLDGSGSSVVSEVRFGGTQADSLGLSDIASDGILNLPANYAQSVLDLSRATSLEKLVITEGNGTGVTSGGPDVGDLLVVGVRNGATLRLEGGFDADVTVHYGPGLKSTEPLKVELVVGDTSGDGDDTPTLNIAHNSDSLHFVSLGGGSNNIGFRNLDGNLSYLKISGNAGLVLSGDANGSFDNGTVTIDASENLGGVTMALTGSQNVTFTGSQGNDIVNLTTGIQFEHLSGPLRVGSVQIVDTVAGNNKYTVDTGTANITVGDGANQINVEAAQNATLVAGNGDKVVHMHATATVPGTGNAHITAGNGNSVYMVGTSVNTVITNGNGNSTFTVGTNSNTNTTITNGDGNSTFTVTAANDVSIANGDGNGNFTITAGNDVTINNGEGASNITVTAADDATITSGNGNTDFTVTATDDATVTNGNGNATFVVSANTAVVNTGNGNSNIAVTGTGNNAEATVTAGNGNTDITVGSVLKATVTSGDGESAITVTATGQASVTSGNGDKTVEINNADAAKVVLGNGDNSVNTDDIDVVSITVGDGENTISSVRGDTVTVVAGNGGNHVTVSAEEINITTGTGNDTVVISGMGSTAIGGDANTTGLLNVHVGAGDNTIVLGRDVSVPGPDLQFGITALEGSSISGENITLYVENLSDLRAAELSGIEKVVLNYDLARPVNGEAGNHNLSPVLTLTDTQFLAIGAANFAVEGAIFNNYAQVKIIVTQTTSLTALGVDSLPRNIDLQLEVQDGVTLTMTAQQLHTKVAPGGVTLSSSEDNNTDLGSGKVIITGAGENFDPFNNNDQVKTIIGGKTYYGGSLSTDFAFDGDDQGTIAGDSKSEWYNVTVKGGYGGYDRPADVPVEVVWTIDGDAFPTVGAHSTWNYNIEIIGTGDVVFTGAGNYGVELGTNKTPFVIDFSQLDGEAVGLTLGNFENVGAVYGNSDNGYAAVVNVELDNLSDLVVGTRATQSAEAVGLISSGVSKYVVTKIGKEGGTASAGHTAYIVLGDATQDLEVLALRGNYNDTLVVENAIPGVTFELQGGAKSGNGPNGTANVGKLEVNYEFDTPEAAVNLVHSVAGDTRDIRAYGIEINNADTITINAGTANATIASIAGDSLDHLVLVGDRNVSITETFVLSADSMNGSDGLDSIDASAVEGNLSLSLSGTAVGSGFDFTASQGTTTLTLNVVTAGAHSSFTAEDAATFNIVVTGSNNLSAATLENVDTISLGKPGDSAASSVTLSAAQALDVGLANIKLGHPGLDGTLNLVNLGSQAFDATTLGAGVELGTVTIAAGNVTLNAGTVLTGAAVTVAKGSTLTLTADQYMALASLEGIDDGATINITGLTQAHIDAGFSLDGVDVNNAVGTISLAESVNLAAGTDLNGFGVILAAGQTLGVATVDQVKDGLVVNGAADSAIKLLFGTLGNEASLDVSGFNVDKLLFQDLLVVDGNTDGIFTGLLPRVEKVMYNNMVQLVDQTVTISAGAIVRGDLAYDFTADVSKEIEDFVLNLQGGTQINGDIDLGVAEKTDTSLIQTYLKTVTINSTGTLANPQTGKTGNIISGKLTAGSESENTQNELLDVTINASQALSIEGGVDFSAVINADEVATLTVNGTANVTIGDLNTQDEGVDGLNVVNNGTGTLTVGINEANIDSTDALSFTGTGNIVLNVAGEVDLSNDDLAAVSAVSLAQGAEVTLTIAQASEIGATHFSTPGAATATLNLTNLDGSLFVRPDFASDITVSVVSVAPLPTVTLNAGTNLTGIDSLAVHEGTTLNLTAAQFQQLNNAGIITLIANNGITADTVINITGLTAADVAGGFSLVGVEGALIVNLQLAESVDLSAATLTGVDSITFGDGVTLTLGDIQQANGVDIVGGANSTLIFKDLGTTLFESIDASGFDVTFLKHTNTLTEGGNRNIDDIFAGLAETITKVVYNGEGWVNAVDQNVIIEAGTTVFDSLVYNKVEADVELQDFTINLMGGVELSGNLRLSTGHKFADADGDGVQDAGEKFLIREYLQTLTINSTGTTGNLLTGVAANIIDGDVTPMGINGSLNNNLLDVTINATQALTITGKLVFNSNVGNDNGGDGMTVNDVKNAVAELKVTGTADVNVGTIDTSDTDVVGLNVVNEGSGTITATINSANVPNADALSFTSTGTGDVHLNVVGNVDLSGDVLTAVSQITIADGATLTLSQVQFDILGAANIIDGGADGSAILNLNGVNAAFDAAAIDANIDVQTLTLAGSMDFAATASNLSGVDSIVVPAGGTLTLTAAQFQQLKLAGSITGVGGSTAYTVHITGLTQADIDGGAFDTTGITAGTITLSLAEDVNLSADDVIDNVDNLILADGQTLGVANYDQANGLKVNVGAASTTNTTIVYKFVTLGTNAFSNPVKQIDASGYNVTTLKAYAASFVSGVSGAVNVEFSIDDLPSAVELRLTNNSDDLGDLGQTFRKVVIEAGVTTPTGLVFNDWDAGDELSTLALTLEGGATLSGDLSIPTRDDKTTGLNQLYFSLLTITSSGTAPNVIDGDISTAPVFAPFDTSENNLLKVVINGTQALTIQGDIVFNKENAGNATAVLNVNSSAAVTLGNVNTQDAEVIGLTVDNAGTGTLSFTVDAANIDSTDALSFTGGNIALTVVGAVNLSDDTITGVSTVKVVESGNLTLSYTQLQSLGAANVTVIDGTDSGTAIGAATLVINGYDGGAFNATALDAHFTTVNLELADQDVTLAAGVNLTNVDQIVVQEGRSLTLTAAQFKQLQGAGNIVTVDTNGDSTVEPIRVFITDLTQADITSGSELLDLGAITGVAVVNLALATTATTVEFGTIAGTTFTSAVLGNASITMTADNQMVGFVTAASASGRTVNTAAGVDKDTTSIVFAFDDAGVAQATESGGVSQNNGGVNAANYDVGSLRALNVFVDGRNIEQVVRNLSGDIDLVVYQSPEDLPIGFRTPVNRTVIIEPSVTIEGPTAGGGDGFVAFIDLNNDREIRNLTVEMRGGTEIDGNLRLASLPDANGSSTAPNPQYFHTLTIVSTGTAANRTTNSTDNVIDGDITAQPVAGTGASQTGTVENNLLNVVINGTQNLVVTGDIVFSKVGNGAVGGGDDAVATLNINNTGTTTIQQLDVSDNDLSGLTIVNNGGLLTVTGASPALTDGNTSVLGGAGANLETLTLSGTGDITFGFNPDPAVTNETGLDLGNVSTINASALSGNLNLGEVTNIDNANFSFISGTGVTTLTLTSDTLLEGTPLTDTGWSFNFANAAAGSAFHLGSAAGTSLGFDNGGAGTAGTLAINLGANTTLYIDENTNLTDLDLLITQGSAPAIVVANGVTLTLTAAQADGLRIVGANGAASTGVVNITQLGTGEYDLSGISADIANTATLAADDVTLDADTNLGAFSITLDSNVDAGGMNLSGQTIRFATQAQADGREIIVANDTSTAPGVNSTNVVWLFESVIDAPLDTEGYDGLIGRLWLKQALLNGANVEQLFTSLPTTIVRSEFTTVNQLDGFLSPSQPVDRVVELVAFTSLPNGMVFNDTDALEGIRSLTLNLGGQVSTGDILIDDAVATGTDPASVVFNELSILSYRALHQDHVLAPEAYVNDNDGTNEVGESVQPDNINTVGNIRVVGVAGSGIDLLTVNLNTLTMSAIGSGLSQYHGANLVVGTITFDAAAKATPVTATLNVAGANNTTVAALDATDGDIDTLSITNSGSGNLVITGASPAASLGSNPAVSNVETLVINATSTGSVTLGTIGNATKPGVSGDDLSLIDVNGSGDVNLGVIAQVDGNDFTLDTEGSSGDVTAVFDGMTLNAGGSWTVEGAWNGGGSLAITLKDTVTLGAGTLTIDDAVITISGNVDFTTLLDLNIVDVNDVTFIVPTGSSLTILAEDADGLTVTGGGVVHVEALEATPDADLSGIMTSTGDTGTVFATVDTTDGADLDLLPETVNLTGNLGIAQVTVLGGGLVDATGATMDATFDRGPVVGNGAELVKTTFVVEAATTLVLTAAQGDDRSVTGAGTTNIEDIGAYAGGAVMSLAGVATTTVNIAVDTPVTLNSADNLGAAGAGRVTTIAAGVTLTSAGSVVNGQYIVGENATLLVDDENTVPVETPITANLSNVSAEFITLVDTAIAGTITFPVLYGSPAAKVLDPNVAVQTVTLTAVQASGQTIVGAGAGAQGEVVVNDLDGAFTNLSNINAGLMTAHVVDTPVVLHAGTDLGEFDVVIDATAGLLTLTAGQADGIQITESGASDATVTVTALALTPNADLSQIAVNDEVALLDANGGVTLGANLGANMEVIVSDSVVGGPNTVTFTGEMVSADTTFTIAANAITLVFDANDAHELTVAEQAPGYANSAVTVNNVDGDLMDLTGITADTLVANVPADAVMHAGTNFGGFNVVLAEGADLTLSFAQFLNVGVNDAALDPVDFSSAAGGVEEIVTVTGWIPATALDTSVIPTTLALKLVIAEGTAANQTVDGTTDLSGVEEIVIPAGVTLTMTADQFQQIQHSVTVTGAGTLNLTMFDNDNASIDLSSVTANAGTISLDPAAGATTVTAGQVTGTPVIVNPAAILDNAAGAKFGIVMTANNQGITLSSESQADGRSVTEQGALVNTRLILGFQNPDAQDGDVNLEASGYGTDEVYVLNTYLFNQFGGVTPANIESFLNDLDPAIPVIVFDADAALVANIVLPTAVTGYTRTFVVEPNTLVNASVLFNDLDADSEVQNVIVNLRGNAYINGNLSLPQNEDPRGQLPTKYVQLFNTLTINSTDEVGTLVSPNVLNGNIFANNVLNGAESQVEVFTLTLDPGMAIAGSEDQIGFDGAVVNLGDGWTVDQVGAALAAAQYTNWGASYDAVTNVVTFTNITAGAMTDATIGSFTFQANSTSANFPGTSAVAVTQQGVFQGNENNLLNVVINAEHDLTITGTLEFRYVSGTESIVYNNNDVTAEANLNIDVDAGVTVSIGSVNTGDDHITALNFVKTGTGTVNAPGTSPGASVGDTETLYINQVDGGVITFGTAGDPLKPGVAGDDLSLIEIDGVGVVNLGVISLVDTAAPVAPAVNSFYLDATGSAGDVTATIGADLAAGGVWRFANGLTGTLNLTINEDASFAAGSTLSIQGATITIDGDIDLSGVDLSGVVHDCEFFVPAGSVLTLSVEQVLAFGVADIDTGSLPVKGGGIVKVVGDATDANSSDLGAMLQTVTVDLSGVTLVLAGPGADADGVLEFQNVGAVDDLGASAPQNLIGSSNDDRFLLSNDNDTVTGGLGNDTYTGGTSYYTYNVDAGTDTITSLYSDAFGNDVLVVSAGATANAAGITEFVATAATVNNGTANLSTDAAGGEIDVSAAGGTGRFYLNGGADVDVLVGGAGSDVINGGLNGLGHDVLTGGLGADYFVFNIVQNNPATPTVAYTGAGTSVGIDREAITITGGAGTANVTIAYRINGSTTLPGTVVDLTGLADTTDANVVAGVVGTQLAGVFGSNATVVVVNNVITLTGANGTAIEILSVTPDNGLGGVSGAISEPALDTPQKTLITIPAGTAVGGDYVVGDILSFTFSFAEGTPGTVNYTVNAGQGVTQAQVTAGVAAAINANWDAVLDTAVTVVGGNVIEVKSTAAGADFGGFSVTASAVGGVSATGASDLNPTTLTSVDQIMDFVSGTDKIILSVAGTGANFESSLVQAATFAAAKAAAETAFADPGLRYFFTAVNDINADASADGVLFFDLNGDAVVDGAIAVIGVTSMAANDIQTTVV